MWFWCSIFVSSRKKKKFFERTDRIVPFIRDGTTDVTRTWHFGQPTPHQMECFTRVLKGQINMGTAVFPHKSKVWTCCFDEVRKTTRSSDFILYREIHWTRWRVNFFGTSVSIMDMERVMELDIFWMFTKVPWQSITVTLPMIQDWRRICLCQMVNFCRPLCCLSSDL